MGRSPANVSSAAPDDKPSRGVVPGTEKLPRL